MTVIVAWPEEDGKLYGYLRYHEWFVQADSLHDLFDWTMNKYATEKWWDYDGFRVCEGRQPHDIGQVQWIDWVAMLSDEQRAARDEAKKQNFNMA